MTDIVQRLLDSSGQLDGLCEEAADEIDNLRQQQCNDTEEIEALRQRVKELEGRPIPLTEWQQMEQKLAACAKERDEEREARKCADKAVNQYRDLYRACKKELARWEEPFDADRFAEVKKQAAYKDSLAAMSVYITALEHALKHKEKECNDMKLDAAIGRVPIDSKDFAWEDRLAATENERNDAITEWRVTHGKLLASQHYAQQLREALEHYRNMASPRAWDCCPANAALSLPYDTSALDALVKERDKYITLLKMAKEAMKILDYNYEEMEGEDGAVGVVPLSLINLCSEALAAIEKDGL